MHGVDAQEAGLRSATLTDLNRRGARGFDPAALAAVTNLAVPLPAATTYDDLFGADDGVFDDAVGPCHPGQPDPCRYPAGARVATDLSAGHAEVRGPGSTW